MRAVSQGRSPFDQSLLCVTLSLADSANICLQSIHSSRLPLNCLINRHGGKHLGMWTPGSLVDDSVLSHVWLCDPMDYTCQAPPSIGVSWARRLEWVAISFSRGFSQSRDQTRVSCVFCIGRQVLYHLGLPLKVPNPSLTFWSSEWYLYLALLSLNSLCSCGFPVHK